MLANGEVFEQGGVNFSHVFGASLPPSATAKRPELANRQFEAMGVSLVIHPRNPYVPTSHANVRFFIAKKDGEPSIWWFGGGFDLTPFYPFLEDVEHWHRTARAACQPFGDEVYPKYKKWCDEYFFLKHRNETRGVGGLFFDDLNEPDFDQPSPSCKASAIITSRPICLSCKNGGIRLMVSGSAIFSCIAAAATSNSIWFTTAVPYSVCNGGRTESILMSLPPLARWQYNWQPEAGSPEAELYEKYLKPQNWLGN